MLYNFIITIAVALLRIIPLRDQKLRDTVRGRIGLIEKVRKEVDPSKPIAWFHCASLGEFEQARELIEQFKREFSKHKILLTFFSSSGYNVRKDYKGADHVFYIPFDTPRATRKFVEAINPNIVIIIKYEFWKNLIYQIAKTNAKLYLVSAIFTPKKVFFKWWGGFFRNILNKFDYIFVQNIQSEELLKSIGVTKCSIAGDTRFDRVFNIVKENKKIQKVEDFCSGEKVFITGSSWEKDDEITFELIMSNPELKFIIAPHELGDKKIANLYAKLKNSNIKVARYTTEGPNSQHKVLILDTIGILSHCYKYGRFAFIGGGFGGGIHNILEAATFGLPLIFGANNKRFAEAQYLLHLGAATEINNSEDAQKWLTEMLQNSELEHERSQQCKKYIDAKKGACEIILKKIQEDLEIKG